MENRFYISNFRSPTVFDESVAPYEVHLHLPYATSTYNNNDEIHIAIQHKDEYLLPCRNSLHIQGKLTQHDGTALAAGTSLINHAICFLFSEIRYELNAIEIDNNKNVGMTTSMKNYPSLNPSQLKFLKIAGWNSQNLIDDKGNFEVSIPLSMILGFTED